MNYIKLLIGILLVFISIIFFLYELKKYRKEKKFDYMIFSFDVKIFVVLLAFFVMGIVMIYRELKHIL